jgi:sugar phosphate isomerase/epimerase
MNRRKFIQQSATGAAALSLSRSALSFFDHTRMGIVVHSYWHRWGSKVTSGPYAGFQNALELIEHCHQIGAGGIQVGVGSWVEGYAKKVREKREKLGLYFEASIGLPQKTEDVTKFENEIKNAKEAGADIIRSVTLGTRRYETFKTMADFELFKKNSLAALQRAEPILKKYQVKLGIENHKDWRADEMVGLLKQISSEHLGVTIDFGNSIALLEDPMEVVQTLAPYVLSTHVKDMAVAAYTDGFLLSEVPLGQGMLDLKKMVAICRQHNPKVTLTLEMITRDPLQIPCLRPDYWTTMGQVTGAALARTLGLVKNQKNTIPLPTVMQLGAEERLAVEEKNILACLAFSREKLEK